MLKGDLYIGQRVCLADGVKGPSCRTGTVESVEKGGALVRHDAADLDLEAAVGIIIQENIKDGGFFTFQTWGWSAAELEPETQVLM